jgi:hypothetical protein
LPQPPAAAAADAAAAAAAAAAAVPPEPTSVRFFGLVIRWYSVRPCCPSRMVFNVGTCDRDLRPWDQTVDCDRGSVTLTVTVTERTRDCGPDCDCDCGVRLHYEIRPWWTVDWIAWCTCGCPPLLPQAAAPA